MYCHRWGLLATQTRNDKADFSESIQIAIRKLCAVPTNGELVPEYYTALSGRQVYLSSLTVLIYSLKTRNWGPEIWINFQGWIFSSGPHLRKSLHTFWFHLGTYFVFVVFVWFSMPRTGSYVLLCYRGQYFPFLLQIIERKGNGAWRRIATLHKPPDPSNPVSPSFLFLACFSLSSFYFCPHLATSKNSVIWMTRITIR